MKKIKLILLTIISLIIFPNIVNAASGSISVSGSSTIVKGNNVKLTVTLSSSTAIGSWQMDLNYDKSYLQLVSSSSEAGGTMMANSSASGTKSKSYTFTFKALKTGSTRVSVSSYLAYAYSDLSELSLSSSSKTIKIITQEELEASYSKDNYLKNLSVEGYELDKEFNKETLEYTVNVPTGTTSVNVIATKNDSTASVNGAGTIEVTEGINSIPIVVTAQNGAEKTYTLTINVEDQNPITVNVNNKTYTVVKNATLLTAPNTFSETTITIDDTEIPAFINESANVTLVGLKDDEGNIELFIYKDNTYSLYNEMNLKNYLLIPVALSEDLDLTKTTITINGEEIEAYEYNDSTDYVIISALNLEDGTTSLYLYDTKNNTAILYNDVFDASIKKYEEIIQTYTYVIIAFASASILMLILIFSLLHSLKKKQKKIDKFIKKQEAKIEATRKLNDVVDQVKQITQEETKNEVKEEPKIEENVKVKELQKDNTIQEEIAQEVKKLEEEKEEVYNIFEDDKKSKKKKK